MNENRHKPSTANFFWEGILTNYEAASINSFVNNNFTVNLWTYGNKSFPKLSKKVQIKDATEILPIKLLNSLNQNFQKANYSSFSNLFRYKLLFFVCRRAPLHFLLHLQDYFRWLLCSRGTILKF